MIITDPHDNAVGYGRYWEAVRRDGHVNATQKAEAAATRCPPPAPHQQPDPRLVRSYVVARDELTPEQVDEAVVVNLARRPVPWTLVAVAAGLVVFLGGVTWTHVGQPVGIAATEYPGVSAPGGSPVAVCVSNARDAVIWADAKGPHFGTQLPTGAGTNGWAARAPAGAALTLTRAQLKALPACDDAGGRS